MSKFKVGDLVTLTPTAKLWFESMMSLEDAPWKVKKVKYTKVWVESRISKTKQYIFHEVHLMLSDSSVLENTSNKEAKPE